METSYINKVLPNVLEEKAVRIMKYLSFLIFSFSLLACSSSHKTSIFDAGTCQYNVYRHSSTSWLLENPEPHFDFWGSWSNNLLLQTNITNNWLQLISTGGVLDRLAEYGVYQGNSDSTVYNTTSDLSGFLVKGDYDAGGWILLDDTSLIANIQTQIQLNRLPYPTDNTIYIISLPSGYLTQKMFNHQWSAYHDHSTYNGQNFTYAFITFGSEDQMDILISHELYEAATDPDSSKGYYDDKSGNEIGDLCEGAGFTINNITVQKVWSKDLCVCE